MTPFLADAIFWVAVVACAVAQIGILRATAAARVAATAAAPAAPVAPVHRPATRLEEALWAALPAVALAGALFLTWRALHPRTAGTAAPIVALRSAA